VLATTVRFPNCPNSLSYAQTKVIFNYTTPPPNQHFPYCIYPLQPTPSVLHSQPLELRVGAQVMLAKNLDLLSDRTGMLVNGSRGVIVDEMDAVVMQGIMSGKAADIESQAIGDDGKPRALTPDESWLWYKYNSAALHLQGLHVIPVVLFHSGRTAWIMPELFTHSVLGRGELHRTQV